MSHVLELISLSPLFDDDNHLLELISIYPLLDRHLEPTGQTRAILSLDKYRFELTLNDLNELKNSQEKYEFESVYSYHESLERHINQLFQNNLFDEDDLHGQLCDLVKIRK